MINKFTEQAVAAGLLLGLFLITVAVTPGASAGEAGKTAAEVLNFGAGARVPALGGAGSAVAHGAASIDYNPAGLGMMNRAFEPGVSYLPVSTAGPRLLNWGRDLQAGYYSLPEGISYTSLSYASSLPDWTNRPRLLEGTWAGGLRYLGYGSQSRVERDGGVLTHEGSFTSSDLVASFAYGQNWDNLAFGATGRYFRQELAGVAADATSFDLGFRWNSRKRPLSAGLVLANLGSGITFEEKEESLPEQLRAGLAHRLYSLAVESTVELQYGFNSRQLDLRGGLEWWLLRGLALRAGYDSTRDVDAGLTAGFGYVRDDLSFDYSYLPYGDFGGVHRLGFRYQMD